MELNGDCKKGKSTKQLLTIEYQKSIYSSIKHHFNLAIKSSLTKLKILIDNEDWKNIPKDNSVKRTDSTVIEKVAI